MLSSTLTAIHTPRKRRIATLLLHRLGFPTVSAIATLSMITSADVDPTRVNMLTLIMASKVAVGAMAEGMDSMEEVTADDLVTDRQDQCLLRHQ